MSFVILRFNKGNLDINISLIANELLEATSCVKINSDWMIYSKQEKNNLIESIKNLSTDNLIDFTAYIGNDNENVDAIRNLLPKNINETIVYDEKTLATYLIKSKNTTTYNPFERHQFTKETIETVQVFLANNMNVSKTSEKMYLHRNTLIQRLDKFKRDTGYDLKQFDDAFICYYYIVPKI